MLTIKLLVMKNMFESSNINSQVSIEIGEFFERAMSQFFTIDVLGWDKEIMARYKPNTFNLAEAQEVCN